MENSWRSIDEFHEKERPSKNEFFEGASVWGAELSRRRFLSLMSSSFALAGAVAGLSGCYRTAEKIIPYVNVPENLTPGSPLYFATAHVMAGLAHGVLVESHDGRPTKVEGNPDHPISKGSADIFDQAFILDLYDPGRSQKVLKIGAPTSWADFDQFLVSKLDEFSETRGEGLRILTGVTSSLVLGDQMRRLKKKYPKMKWISHEPLYAKGSFEGGRQVFGRPLDIHYDFSKADVILSLDSDFLFETSASLKYARDFIRKKKVRKAKPTSSRFYALECTPHLTGASSDHLLSLDSRALARFARSLLVQLRADEKSAVAGEEMLTAEANAFLENLVRDLKKSQGRSLVIAGAAQPVEIHVLAHLINDAVKNLNETVFFTDPVIVPTDGDLRALVSEMQNKEVKALFILDSNPVYSAAESLKFSGELENIPLKVHLGSSYDETARKCDWHLPLSHSLETWGDARSADGTTTIIQPLIVPLYETRGILELISKLSDPRKVKTDHAIVEEFWRGRTDWNETLRNGIVKDSSVKIVKALVKSQTVPTHADTDESVFGPGSDYELILRADPTIYDGRFSTNPWLQELPKPLTKMVWGNAVLISPQVASQLDLTNGDFVEVAVHADSQMSLRGPVCILPGQPARSVTLHFGYGRGDGTSGINAFKVWDATKGYFNRCSIKKVEGHEDLVVTQIHHGMEGRDLARSLSLDAFVNSKTKTSDLVFRPTSLYGEMPQSTNAWGMSIDLGSCIGCNACILACQAENNIPVVGKEQVALGREMHWIRIDRYYSGDLHQPQTLFQPVLCMHCEQAPCEVVCPVAATVHSDEGLNEMVYNRCVGTRYCSNNCPYKVRRFNFLEYNKVSSEISKFQKNPDVSVRSRGVMEKCSYCVQRITKGRLDAEKENRPLRDGEIKTACQATCPSEAIVFGNLKDAKSEVVAAKSEPHQYSLLGELGTRPRTTYLARVTNPAAKAGEPT